MPSSTTHTITLAFAAAVAAGRVQEAHEEDKERQDEDKKRQEAFNAAFVRFIGLLDEEYPGWRSKAKRLLPRHLRRATDEEDAIQFAFFKLIRCIRNGKTHFANRYHAANWLVNHALYGAAKDCLKNNIREKGLSAFSGPSSKDGQRAYDSMNSYQDARAIEMPPDLQLKANEIERWHELKTKDLKRKIADLKKAIDSEIRLLDEKTRKLVMRWLQGAGYKRSGAEAGVSGWETRDTTFNFVRRPPIRDRGELILHRCPDLNEMPWLSKAPKILLILKRLKAENP